MRQNELRKIAVHVHQFCWAHNPPLLDRIHKGAPRALEFRLASSPEFYCEVIRAVFRSENDDRDAARKFTEGEKRIGQAAYSLLHGWSTLPGTSADGNFDGDKFSTWLETVKILSQESGHLRIAMDQLGQALPNAPADPDGLWIHRSVAAALDARDLPSIRPAFTTGLFNRRGVHTFTQGEEEKRIAADYREKAKALSDAGFFRIADEVRRLAEQYEVDAKREAQTDIFDDR